MKRRRILCRAARTVQLCPAYLLVAWHGVDVLPVDGDVEVVERVQPVEGVAVALLLQLAVALELRKRRVLLSRRGLLVDVAVVWASAVAAVPFDESEVENGWAYLSSGTWSLLGAELPRSFASTESCAAPFTNELGLTGTTRFLKNIAGLWLVQESSCSW